LENADEAGVSHSYHSPYYWKERSDGAEPNHHHPQLIVFSKTVLDVSG
jgi:hypothetical protein